ncbi:MAG: aspartate--tRNA ligase [Gemmataceae bacterium]
MSTKSSWQRTHTCGELREEQVGQSVVLNGWVHTHRDHGVFVFVDLRDRYGLTQIVFEPDRGEELFKAGQELNYEVVICVKGTVAKRLPGKENPNLPTGQIEVKVEELTILNKCPVLPFEVNEKGGGEDLANEDLRLQYRYLDLRRPTLQNILALRHRICKTMRDYLDELGFLEIETPLLGRSTPEGARDYLVPSRLFLGEWYALPQSPQLYKQLLMIAGYDKYFQIARCLRDEDLRANRQPEFTQLDMEMSFVEMDDVLEVLEGLTKAIFQRCIGVEVETPIQRIPYEKAMLRYGSDKPDLRFDMEIIDIAEIAEKCDFGVFKDTIANGGKVRGLAVKGAAEKYSRKQLKELETYASGHNAKGLAWMKVEADAINAPIAKFFSEELQEELRTKMVAEPGDLLLFVADREAIVCQALGALRTHLALQLGLYDPDAPVYKMAWIVDFPLFFWDEEEERWFSNHHPFTAPRDEDIDKLESDPGLVRAKAYDLAINGDECAGGSIRIHTPEIQQRIFNVLGIDAEMAKGKFGFLLEALSFGAPPHGGIALGLDRWVMMLARTTNIRDTIAFPKNARARDLMTGAPSEVDEKQLKELFP